MLISERQQNIVELLRNNPAITVAKLAATLHVSEPTIRRDFTELAQKGFITKFHGGARLNYKARPDSDIPFILRENEKSIAKSEICHMATSHIRNGMVLMLDSSSTVFHIVPYLAKFRDLIVITNGARTAVSLAEQNIRTFCTGGEMILNSFSYVGKEAEEYVRIFNADLLFFSCRGLTEDGKMTDVSAEEMNVRKAMIEQSKRKILLCDDTKIGNSYFYNLGNAHDIDAIISNVPFSLRDKTV